MIGPGFDKNNAFSSNIWVKIWNLLIYFVKLHTLSIDKLLNIYIFISISTKKDQTNLYRDICYFIVSENKSVSFSFFLRAPLALCLRLFYNKDLSLVENSHTVYNLKNATYCNSHTVYNLKHCQRHNGPEGWVHITSS